MRKETPSIAAPTPDAIRKQLEVIVEDPGFRSSRRSIQFLSYVVGLVLEGRAEEIKERTLGVEIFGRDPSYDTATDHIVRTAAIELRKRLAVYYDEESHRDEVRIGFVRGSYVPQFSLPAAEESVSEAAEERCGEGEHEAGARHFGRWWLAVAAFVAAIGLIGYYRYEWNSPLRLFWRPVFSSPGPVLLAMGDISAWPPPDERDTPAAAQVLSADVPYADTVTIARVLSALQMHNKRVVIRQENNLKFSDFRDSPAVLVGAFNNEWSMRLTRSLRFSLALDTDHHLLYIRDARNPSSRGWSQVEADNSVAQLNRGAAVHQDYALVSRVWNPETGHVVVVIAGLFAYGTEAAGEFVTDDRLLRTVAGSLEPKNPKANVQIVLETTVTDSTPGLARVVAVDVD